MKLLELSSTVKRISTKVAEDDLVRLLKTEAKNSYDATRKQPIFTKVETKEPFFTVDPSKAARTSKFIIDELVTLLPSWRGWTNRLKSVRGWTDRDIADNRGSGELCLLIPYDHARVHVCGEARFYRSFSKAQKAFEVTKVDNDALHSWLKSLYKVARSVDNGLGQLEEPETAKQLLSALKRLDKVRKDVLKTRGEDINGVDREDVRRAWAAFSDELEASLSKLLDPDDNGFSTYTSLYNLPEGREIWTGSKCVVIKLSEYVEMVKRGTLK